jgi:hypothetical protein
MRIGQLPGQPSSREYALSSVGDKHVWCPTRMCLDTVAMEHLDCLEQIFCCCELDEGMQYRFSREKRTSNLPPRHTPTGNLL